MDLAHLQDVIERTYGERDRERGVPSTVAWLAEEVGELAQAVRKGDHAQRVHEFADVLAWVASLANQVDVDLVGPHGDGWVLGKAKRRHDAADTIDVGRDEHLPGLAGPLFL